MTERMKKGNDGRGLLDLLLDEHVALRPYSGSIMVVVNRRCVSFDEKLKDGDEVALLPPVGGGE
jgi:molybdopterin converting factor small subunit